MQSEIVLCHAVRTAIGGFNGALRDVSATALGATVIRAVTERAGLAADAVDGVVMGQVVQAGSGMNPARQAAIHGGLDVSIPAMTVNRVCGSGAQAIVSAAQDILSGQGSVMLAGGMENMDRAPYLVSNGRWGYRMGHAQIYDSMLLDGLHDAFSQKHSGWHTEDLVAQQHVDRDAQDRWALRSQQRFVAARDAGLFDGEIVPVDVPSKKGAELFLRDEAPRSDTTFEGLARLKPAFRENGTITAGNAPGLNSGAAAMVVAARGVAEARGLVPMARLAGFAVTAVEPGMFGIAPVSAVKLAVQRAGWRLHEVDRFEINEAYAAIAVIVARELGLDEERVNVEGGAVAHGHPIGATGAVLTTRLLHAMRRERLRRGVVTLCIGGGQGIALALEAL
ncbi:thiolase family protein [Dyella nitratireducens]|uniref:Acetyl-CoA acetyltransferase n=1 Tax=Dyella nitratireducens TaxID=1849580 RepID=A0ABQ1FSQ3_9GAMM|nr:thiolase family protein [Dyella nitratireducens]GGA28615.1 acetyl-CoA acetyltransferase [Dyella nitratireducens]GLQ43256.1 acetyl-CoA acetyltransferase [Dyella nitratireducens]